MSVKIAFHTDFFDVRGTCVSLYDYAHYNETILNNKSIILIPRKGLEDTQKSDLLAIQKFYKRFNCNIFPYEDFEHMELILEFEKCDILYCIKYGKNDGFVSKKVKTVVHCVFDMSEPHGDVYAGVSEQIANKFGHTNFVPHMIPEPSKTTDNMREELGIPSDATVFGRIGGADTFDIEFVKETIRRTVRILPHIYFIFVNTPPFDNHPNIIYIDKIVDPDLKNKFIMSCDGMIHAQSLGETFGIAIGEFSVNNKVIICFGGYCWNDNFKKILGDKAIYYMNDEHLLYIFAQFNKKDYEGKDLNCYKDYSPNIVMQQFKKVFID